MAALASGLFCSKDAIQGKPHIMDPSNRVRLYASAFYHGMVSVYPIYLGIKDLVQN